MERGVWPTSAKNDPLLMKFIGVVETACADRVCDACPVRTDCLKLYDGLVDRSSRDLLTGRKVEKALTRFKPPLL